MTVKTGKRQNIIKAAKELLLEVGYEAMSPRKVLQRSGAGQGSLYHHFSGKKHLAQTVLDEVAEELKAEFLKIFRDEKLSPLEKLDHYLARPRKGLVGCKLGRLSNEPAFRDNDLRQPLQDFFNFAISEIETQIDLAKEQGMLPPDAPSKAIAHMIVASIQGGYVLSKSTNTDSAVNTATQGARALLRGFQQ